MRAVLCIGRVGSAQAEVLGVNLSALVLQQTASSSASATGTSPLQQRGRFSRAHSPSMATSSLGEPAPFSHMVSQPCPGSGELIPMKINRVRNPKTCLRTDRIAFMHFCELAGFDPAILQKPDENFPACWTIVKWLDLTCSVYRIKVHSGATLNPNFLCVTRSLSQIGPAGYHRRLWPKRAVVIAGHENNRPSKPRLNVPRAREIVTVR
jgi:hypothetical protein